MPHFRTSGANLYYEQTGSGPDIVWLPGGDQRGEEMRWQVGGFPDFCNTTMDPRGVGETEHLEGPPWSILDMARDAVLDTVGVMIAGASDQAAKRVRRAVALWGNGPSTVVGQPETLAAPWAALANGTAAHVLDFDDSFSPVSGHSSAVMVPALLALAEAEGVSGHAILDAYVVGLEIQARVGQSVNVSLLVCVFRWKAVATS